jgi:hypothetical protein
LSSPAQPGEKDFYQEFFANLERRLAAVSHADEAALIVESAMSEQFKKTAQRQIAFAQQNIICVEPISYSGALASGAINADEDQFTMLQGDIVSAEAAYLMGERIVGSPMFAVLNSTCDLVPGRREYASLLRVFPVTGEGDALKSTLHHLLSFRSRRDLYLPPLPNEDVPTLGYSIRFDGVAQIRMEDLLLAKRLCSLSLVGWRIFGSFARVLISRAGDGEATLRSKLQRQSS